MRGSSLFLLSLSLLSLSLPSLLALTAFILASNIQSLRQSVYLLNFRRTRMVLCSAALEWYSDGLAPCSNLYA